MNKRYTLDAQGGTYKVQMATATFHVSYSFTAQFVAGAALQALRARQLEGILDADPIHVAEHRSVVVAAIHQAVAAMESDLNAVVEHGPGHHMGSNGIDQQARALLASKAEAIDREPGGVTARWAMIFKLLDRQPGNSPHWRGTKLWQDAGLLVDVRNELVHYRPTLGGATPRRPNLARELLRKKMTTPPFNSKVNNDFPIRILSADLADWCVVVASSVIDASADALEVATSPLDGHRRSEADLARVMPPRGAQWKPKS